MKKFLTLSLFLCCWFVTYAQKTLYLHGKLNAPNNVSVAFKTVHLSGHIYTSGTSYTYYSNDRVTDASGMYGDTIMLPATVSSATFIAVVTDCKQSTATNAASISATTTELTLDLLYCNDSTDTQTYWLKVNGKLNSNIVPVNNLPVHLSVMPANSPNYQKDLFTDGNGNYADSVEISANANYGNVEVSIHDCQGYSRTREQYFQANNPNVTFNPFNYCPDSVQNPGTEWVHLGGTLTSQNASVANQGIVVELEGTSGPFQYSKSIHTNSQGVYADSVSVPKDLHATYTVYITDCNGTTVTKSTTTDHSNRNVNLDFDYCKDSLMSYVYLSGTVSADNGPVASIPVHIQSYDLTYQKDVITDSQGVYHDSVPFYPYPGTSGGEILVRMINCYGDTLVNIRLFQQPTSSLVIDFTYCSDTTATADSNQVIITGQLTSSTTSVENKTIHIWGYNAANPYAYSKLKYSDAGGYYGDTIPLPAGITTGTFWVVISDCSGKSASGTITFSPGNHHFKIDFNYCSYQPDTIHVSGQLYANNTSVSHIPVHLNADGNNYFSYDDDIFTDSTGHYSQYIALPAGVTYGQVQAKITDCNYIERSDYRFYNPSDKNLVINLTYCTDSAFTPDSSTYVVYVSGTLSSNGASVNQIPVSIHTYSYQVFNYNKTVFTNNNGDYLDSISVPTGVTGTVVASILSCKGNANDVSSLFNINNRFMVMNFTYCMDSTVTPDSLQYKDVEGVVYGVDSAQGIPDYVVYLVRTFGQDTVPVVLDSLTTHGYYKFSNVYAGKYLVKAMLKKGAPLESRYLPTYYGEMLGWIDATRVNRPAANQEYDNIWLLATDTTPGAASISGTIFDENGGGMEGVQVLLKNVDNGLIAAYTNSDSQGNYLFAQLPFGHYMVWAEILGKIHETEDVDVNATNPVSIHNDFKVVGDQIMAIQAGTGIAGIAGAEGGARIFPNPATTNAVLSIYMPKAMRTTVILYSITGSKLWQVSADLQAGDQQISLPLELLEKGVYMVETINNNKKSMIKLVKE